MNKTRQYLPQKPTSTSGGNGLNVWLTEEFFLSLKWIIKFSLKWVTSSSSYVRLFLSHFFVMSIRSHVFLRFKALIKHNDIFFKSWHFSVTNCMSWVISVRNYPLLYCQHYIQQIARSKLVFLSTLPQSCQNIGHMNFPFLCLYLFWYFLFTLISIQSNKTITKKKSQDVHYQKYKNSPCLFANNNHKILFTLNVPC